MRLARGHIFGGIVHSQVDMRIPPLDTNAHVRPAKSTSTGGAISQMKEMEEGACYVGDL